MKRSIVIVGWGMAFLALAGCSSDEPSARTSAAGKGQGGGVATGGSVGQAGQEPGQGGGGSQATGGAGTTGGGGASGNEMTDTSTTAKDAANGDATDLDAGDWKVLFN